MWKKVLPFTVFTSLIIGSTSQVVSCGVMKQKQLSFNINDWKNAWAFNTQSIWQALGDQKSGVILKESDGLFLNQTESLNISQLFKTFDKYHIKQSNSQHLETYLQLKYFIPSIIFYNEKKYQSPLKDFDSINNNFEFEYSSKSTTKVHNDFEPESHLDEKQQGPVVELSWSTTQAGETLNAYFDVTVRLKNPKTETTPDDKTKFVSPDGYYLETDEKNPTPEIKWALGIYFYLPSF